MKAGPDKSRQVPAKVQDPDLVNRRRAQIVDAAVRLFVDKGFHKTTTREIAAAVGFSIGSLYEYVSSKEDILFLVCQAIHVRMEAGVRQALDRASGGRQVLAEMIREFFLVCDQMSDHILLVYQETQSLPANQRKQVLEDEMRVVGLFSEALMRLAKEGSLPPMDRASTDLSAHNIVMCGHSWPLRRWHLARQYTIEEYSKLQTVQILGSVAFAAGNGGAQVPK